MPVRRGDNIPTVADYAHYNEEAEAMWYAENRYDMEHADEIIEDDEDDGRHWDEPDPLHTTFTTREAAQGFYDALETTPEFGPLEWNGEWYIEHYGCGDRGAWTGRPCVRDMNHRGMHRYFVWPPLPIIVGVQYE